MSLVINNHIQANKMRRKIKPIDINELIDADDINQTSIKNEMRKLWSGIHQKLTDGGWTARDMVRWLGEHGVEMSIELFRVYLRDLDKEHGFERSRKEYIKKGGAPAPSKSHTPGKKVASTSSKPVVVAEAKPSGRKSVLLNNNKGIFAELNPAPADGSVDLKQK